MVNLFRVFRVDCASVSLCRRGKSVFRISVYENLRNLRINPLRVRDRRAEIGRNRNQPIDCKHLNVKWLRKMDLWGAARQSATGDGEWRVARGGHDSGGRASNFGKMVRQGARLKTDEKLFRRRGGRDGDSNFGVPVGGRGGAICGR